MHLSYIFLLIASICFSYTLNAENSGGKAVVSQTKHRDKLSKSPSFVADEGYQAVTIAQLADFKLNSRRPRDLSKFEAKHFINNQIPVNILKLNGQQIQIEGFIYPLELEGDKATVFLLLPSLMGCCFSKMPELNEYVYVEMEEGAEVASETLAIVYGNLTMGDRVFQSLDESVVYLLKATKVKIL